MILGVEGQSESMFKETNPISWLLLLLLSMQLSMSLIWVEDVPLVRKPSSKIIKGDGIKMPTKLSLHLKHMSADQWMMSISLLLPSSPSAPERNWYLDA